MPPAESNQSPKLNLPPPVIETGGLSASTNEATKAETNVEKMPASPETGNSSKTPVLSNPPVQQIDLSALNSAPTLSSTVAPSTTSIVTPVIADDNDLIEKEWVLKAKKIVDLNRENPYNQSKEMTVFKADYMKKRYNKTVKISE